MPTEKTLQAFLLRKSRAAGMLAYKTASVGSRGFPDCVLVAQGGRVVFVEVKHPNGKGRLSRHQEIVLSNLTTFGAETHVIDSYDGATDLIRSIAGPAGRD
jgi:hypothetical protein